MPHPTWRGTPPDSSMAIRIQLASALTDAFLGGPWTAVSLRDRATSLFKQDHVRPWLDRLVMLLLAKFPDSRPRPTERVLLTFVRTRTTIEESERNPGSTHLKRWRPRWHGSMQPVAGPPSQWTVPPIVSIPELAEWLDITAGELAWFANCAGWSSKSARESLVHYRYRWIKKSSGGLRLLESPKPRLKQIQRQILEGILARVPVNSAAHAFRPGHSVATYVAPHTGRQVVVHIDLREFFLFVQASHVNALFRTMGYPESVSKLLTGICTNSTPSTVLHSGMSRLENEASWLRYRTPHLPQGAPTSPCLANLSAYKLDQRLTGLAQAMSAQYTRYADDLVFSGDRGFQRSLPRLMILINAIILDEGFEIRHRKTNVCHPTLEMSQG